MPFQAEIIAGCVGLLTIIITFIGVYFKGKSQAKSEVKLDSAEDLLDDIKLKNEISDEGKDIISNGTHAERYDRL